MQISSVNSMNGLPFKAQVESTSPLVSGNWSYLQKPEVQTQQAPQKKSSFMKKLLYTIGAVAVIGAALVGLRNTNAIKTVMSNTNSLAEAETLGQKAKYIVGKGGDWAKAAYDYAATRITNIFKRGE